MLFEPPRARPLCLYLCTPRMSGEALRDGWKATGGYAVRSRTVSRAKSACKVAVQVNTLYVVLSKVGANLCRRPVAGAGLLMHHTGHENNTRCSTPYLQCICINSNLTAGSNVLRHVRCMSACIVLLHLLLLLLRFGEKGTQAPAQTTSYIRATGRTAIECIWGTA
jgi:hypothetical protein